MSFSPFTAITAMFLFTVVENERSPYVTLFHVKGLPPPSECTTGDDDVSDD
uniref:Uncharacterized protein n=1 Tax=uncultured marine virus TaxID=186617 RepID=A0A0F7LAS2_9VIRU|nr:hypothetical protein [uncultured marine virus]